MSLEPGISGLTHARGVLAGETRPLLSNNSFFPNPPGWEHTRSQRHGRVKRSHPASPEVACTIYADEERWPRVTFTYRRAAGVLLCPGSGAVAHWAVSRHLLDHRQENLAST